MIGACASQPVVHVDRDAHANFAAYTAFAWLAADKAADTSLTETRIRSAVVAALQSKGYTYDAEHPNFKVAATLNACEKPNDSGMHVGVGAGGGSGHFGGGVGLSFPIGKRVSMTGVLTLDMIDTARNAQVWTGSYESAVEDKQIADTTAQRMVATILSRWPNRGAEK
jgi:hypothetical protein